MFRINFRKFKNLFDLTKIAKKNSTIKSKNFIFTNTFELKDNKNNSKLLIKHIPLKDLKILTKFKLSIMNTFSAFVPFYCLNPVNSYFFIPYFLFTGGTLLISMTSQVLNQLSEKEMDKKMIRTQNRPLANNKYSDEEIKNLAKILTLFSSVCYLPLNFFGYFPIKTIILSYSIVGLYNLIYTPLKRYSNLSMHVGALVGAVVPFLGSLATTGLLYNQLSIVLGIFIFAWQYPHFYGIVYRHKKCYDNAGFEFISKYKIKNKSAKFQIFVALIVMIMCGIKLYLIDDKNIYRSYFLLSYLTSMVALFYYYPTFIAFPKRMLVASYPSYMILMLWMLFTSTF
jgi:protoheme IX farnesyltransferase